MYHWLAEVSFQYWSPILNFKKSIKNRRKIDKSTLNRRKLQRIVCLWVVLCVLCVNTVTFYFYFRFWIFREIIDFLIDEIQEPLVMDDLEDDTPGRKPMRLPKKAAKVKNKVQLKMTYFDHFSLMIWVFLHEIQYFSSIVISKTLSI